MANAKPDAARLQARLDALTRSYESLEREVEHYQQVANCVRRTQRALAQSRRTEEILTALLKQVAELVPLSRSAILEWGTDGLTARTVAVHGFRSSPALIGRHVPLAEVPELIADKSGWTNWNVRFRHKDGGHRYLESSAVPILFGTGFGRAV